MLNIELTLSTPYILHVFTCIANLHSFRLHRAYLVCICAQSVQTVE